MPIERFETVVVGGGQAGLAVGHQLVARDIDSVILSDEARVGERRTRCFEHGHSFDGDRAAGWPADLPPWQSRGSRRRYDPEIRASAVVNYPPVLSLSA